VTYLFLFRLEELGAKEIMKYVKRQNIRKMHLVGLISAFNFLAAAYVIDNLF